MTLLREIAFRTTARPETAYYGKHLLRVSLKQGALLLKQLLRAPQRSSQSRRTAEALNRDPFDRVAGDYFLATVVQPRGSGISMAGQILHVFKEKSWVKRSVTVATRSECGGN